MWSEVTIWLLPEWADQAETGPTHWPLPHSCPQFFLGKESEGPGSTSATHPLSIVESPPPGQAKMLSCQVFLLHRVTTERDLQESALGV